MAAPVLNTRAPLTPAVPESDVWKLTLPLLVAEPLPLANETAPPVVLELNAAVMLTKPPIPVVVLPDVIVIDPATPTAFA